MKALPEIISQKVALETARASTTRQSGRLLEHTAKGRAVEFAVSSEEKAKQVPSDAYRRKRVTPTTACSSRGWSLGNLVSIQTNAQGDQYRADIRLPHWLANKVFEAHTTRLFSGWQYTLLSRNILTKEAEQCIEHDDLECFQTLLAQGQVTPFDCTLDRLTVSWVRTPHPEE